MPPDLKFEDIINGILIFCNSLKARRGAKKAIVAIAHRILLGIYHVIKDGVEFRDLGEDYLKNRNQSQKVSNLRKQAQALGFELVQKAA
jgi:hypothetical protein